MVRVFLSHNWGSDGAVHDRVLSLASTLKDRGLDVWVDEDRMRGNIVDCMCDGIDRCDVFLVFVTRSYIHKVQFGGDDDNVRREFMYAQTSGKRMLAIRFDETLPRRWPGPVGMMLGSSLYVDCSDPRVENTDLIVRLVRQMCTRLQMVNAVTTAQAAVRLREPRRPVSPLRSSRRPLSPRPSSSPMRSSRQASSAPTLAHRLNTAAAMLELIPSPKMNDTLEQILYTLDVPHGGSSFIERLERVEMELGVCRM